MMSETIYGGTAQLIGNVDISYRQDNLIVGNFQLVTDNVTLKGKQGILARGTILGKDSNNAYLPCVKDAKDGSQTPVAVLSDTYDTTNDDVNGAAVYLTGEFNAHRIIHDASWKVDELQAALRPLSIFLKNVIIADDPT